MITYPPYNKEKPLLVVDVSPLWELEYTGIANVVYEITKRLTLDSDQPFNLRFSVFFKFVDTGIIKSCIDNRSGKELQSAFHGKDGIQDIEVDRDGRIDGTLSFGLFLHRKPNHKIFHKDSYLFYDFSFLLAQECHTKDTVNYHSDGLLEQIASTDLFFCISESTANDLRWLFNAPKDKTVVALLGNNVDTRLAERARQEIRGRKIEPYFLMLGTIEPRKNIGIIFEWLSQNPSILSKFRFVFAGRQGWGPSFSEYVDKYNLSGAVASNRIVHLGYVDEALKATLIVGATAIFYPSIFEGFGLPVLEAMELETPVIASCSTSIPEVLGDTGYYFDPYSIESLDKAIAAFFLDQKTDRLRTLLSKAKARASEFSYDKTYSTIINSLVSNFLEDPPPPLNRTAICNTIKPSKKSKILFR